SCRRGRRPAAGVPPHRRISPARSLPPDYGTRRCGVTEREAPRSVLTSPSAAGGHYGAGAPHVRGNITPAADNRTTLERAAVAYARRGWPVLPCVPRGKLPLTRRGYLDASADVEQVAAWWRHEPYANIGLAPAGVTLPDGGSIVVIDLGGAA